MVESEQSLKTRVDSIGIIKGKKMMTVYVGITMLYSCQRYNWFISPIVKVTGDSFNEGAFSNTTSYVYHSFSMSVIMIHLPAIIIMVLSQ